MTTKKRSKMCAKSIQERQTASTINNNAAEPVPKQVRQGQARIRSARRSTASLPTSGGERALKSLAVTTQAVRELMEDDTQDDEKIIQELKENLRSISCLLRSQSTSGKLARTQQHSKGIEQLEKLYVLRNSRKEVIFLRPIDVIPCTGIYNCEKNVAYFRLKGGDMPIAYAFSGMVPCTKDQLIVMDSNRLKDQVRDLGDFHDHFFQSNGWDVAKGLAKGDGAACHAELQAMLAAAFYLLENNEELSRQTKGRNPVGQLHLLNQIKSGKEIEIGITEEPCSGCKEFRQLLYHITGIEFTFVILKNLGAIKKQWSPSEKKKMFPKFDRDGFVQSGGHPAEVTQLPSRTLENKNEHHRNELRKATSDHHGTSKNRLSFPMVVIGPKSSDLDGLAQSIVALRSKPTPITPPRASIFTRKRSYHHEEDWEYAPPGPRTPKRSISKSVLLTPGEEEIMDLDMMEQRIYETSRITERFIYHK